MAKSRGSRYSIANSLSSLLELIFPDCMMWVHLAALCPESGLLSILLLIQTEIHTG